MPVDLSHGLVVDVLGPLEAAVGVISPGPAGPQGPPGTPGGQAAAVVHQQITPASTWAIPWTVRASPPLSAVYVTSGGMQERVLEDAYLDTSGATPTFVITWPAPTAGVAVLA